MLAREQRFPGSRFLAFLCVRKCQIASSRSLFKTVRIKLYVRRSRGTVMMPWSRILSTYKTKDYPCQETSRNVK